MRKRMESVDDLIEEAKLRTVGWALCVFAISYFLTRERPPDPPSFGTRLLPCFLEVSFFFCPRNTGLMRGFIGLALLLCRPMIICGTQLRLVMD